MDTEQKFDEMRGAVEDLKGAIEKRDDEVEELGEARQETKSEIKNINETISQLEAKLNRAEIETGSDDGVAQSDEEKAFLDWARKGEDIDPEQKALVEDATGQILVPDTFEERLRRDIGQINVLRDLVQVQGVGSNIQKIQRMGEVSVGWGSLETGANAPESTPTVSESNLHVEELNGLAKLGRNLLADGRFDLEAELRARFRRAVADAEEQGIMKGTGHGNEQPEGILDSGAGVQSITTNTQDEVSVKDLLDLQQEVPTQFDRNGTFLVSRDVLFTMRSEQGSDGQFLWRPAMEPGMPSTFNGRPVVEQADLDAIPSNGSAANFAVYGDFREGYKLIDRAGISVQRLVEKYATDGQIGYLFTFRVGGGVVETNALRYLENA